MQISNNRFRLAVLAFIIICVFLSGGCSLEHLPRQISEHIFPQKNVAQNTAQTNSESKKQDQLAGDALPAQNAVEDDASSENDKKNPKNNPPEPADNSAEQRAAIESLQKELRIVTSKIKELEGQITAQNATIKILEEQITSNKNSGLFTIVFSLLVCLVIGFLVYSFCAYRNKKNLAKLKKLCDNYSNIPPRQSPDNYAMLFDQQNFDDVQAAKRQEPLAKIREDSYPSRDYFENGHTKQQQHVERKTYYQSFSAGETNSATKKTVNPAEPFNQPLRTNNSQSASFSPTQMIVDYFNAINSQRRQDDFIQKYKPIRIAVDNSMQRITNPTVEPVYKSKTDGNYMAIQLTNNDLGIYYVVPRFKLVYEKSVHGPGAMGKVFAQNFPGGDQSFNQIEVLSPAQFRKINDSWILVKPGEIRLSER